MKQRTLLASLLVALVSISTLLLFGIHLMQPSGAGFRIYSVGTNTTLISDSDILSYNWTSQELAITTEASERLTKMDDLYSWPGFVMTIDGEEVYTGVFRQNTMSALPAPPQISIMFPSVFLPSQEANSGAMRMFFPSFQPPGDQQASNEKILQYFERTSRLEY